MQPERGDRVDRVRQEVTQGDRRHANEQAQGAGNRGDAPVEHTHHHHGKNRKQHHGNAVPLEKVERGIEGHAYAAGTDDYPKQAQAVLQNVLDLANRIDRGESLEW